MADEIARIGDGGCIESLPNGNVGQVLTIGADGTPHWISAADCEFVQDCVGEALAPGSGIGYNDTTGSLFFDANGLTTDNAPTNISVVASTASLGDGGLVSLATLAQAVVNSFNDSVACAVPSTILARSAAAAEEWYPFDSFKHHSTITVAATDDNNLGANNPSQGNTIAGALTPATINVTNGSACKNQQYLVIASGISVDVFMPNGTNIYVVLAPSILLNGIQQNPSNQTNVAYAHTNNSGQLADIELCVKPYMFSFVLTPGASATVAYNCTITSLIHNGIASLTIERGFLAVIGMTTD